MKLFPRTLFIIALTFIVLILVVNTVFIGMVGQQLNLLEKRDMSKSMDRVESLIHNQQEEQLVQLRDNAHWDDLYAYVQDPNGSFVEAYFVADTFEYMNLNYVLVFDVNGTMVDGRAYDFMTDNLTDVPAYLLDFVAENPSLLHFDRIEDDHQMITRIEDQVAMIETCPILTTDEEGPAMGAMLMGRAWDEREVGRLSALGDVDLEVHPAFESDMPADFRSAMDDPALMKTNRSFHIVDSGTVTMFAPLRDSNGELVMIMKVTDDRVIFDQGMVAFQYINAFLLIVLAVDSIALLYLFTRYVIRPISGLNQEMRSIGNSGDLSARVPTPKHKDELSELSGAFNEMMVQLESKDQGLKESEQRYRGLVESSTDWIWQTDENWRFMFSNTVAATILGLNVDEIGKMSVFDLVDPRERVQIEKRFTDLKDQRLPLKGELLTITAKDGKRHLFEMNAQPIIDGSGAWRGYNGMARDITDRIMNEKALEKSNRQLNLLSSITRHDILNQATILSGYAELLREKIADPELVQHLEKQQKAIDTVVRQIKFTSIYQQLGTQEPIWQNVPLLLDSVMRQLDLRGMKVKLDVLPIEILADPILERAFYNLFDNALRHSGASEMRISTMDDGNDLLIVFEDNGKGVPEDRKERIFSRGFGQNSGLGLFLVREVLATTDIGIKENGIPGSGARFEIRVGKNQWRSSS